MGCGVVLAPYHNILVIMIYQSLCHISYYAILVIVHISHLAAILYGMRCCASTYRLGEVVLCSLRMCGCVHLCKWMWVVDLAADRLIGPELCRTDKVLVLDVQEPLSSPDMMAVRLAHTYVCVHAHTHTDTQWHTYTRAHVHRHVHAHVPPLCIEGCKERGRRRCCLW